MYDGLKVVVADDKTPTTFRSWAVLVGVHHTADGVHLEVWPFCKGEVHLAEWVAGKLRHEEADDYILGEDVTHLARPKGQGNREASASVPVQKIDVEGEADCET